MEWICRRNLVFESGINVRYSGGNGVEVGGIWVFLVWVWVVIVVFGCS